MNKKYLVILSGSPRGGERTWLSLFKYVVEPLNADLAICTTDNFLDKNILFERADYKWLMDNPTNFENYYEKYYKGTWKDYLNKGKGLGLYESGMIHFALKDYIKRKYLNILKEYEYIIYSRFDQYYIDYHPDVDDDKLYIPSGENYFGVCDRHAVFKSSKAKDFLSIVEYIDSRPALNELPKHPNCESVYKKHLESIDLLKDIERFKRISFTAAIKNEHTNWRVPKFKIFFTRNLMIKYPDEYISGFKYKYSDNNFISYIYKDFPLNLYFLYLKLRQYLGGLIKKETPKLCEDHKEYFSSSRYENIINDCPECGKSK